MFKDMRRKRKNGRGVKRIYFLFYFPFPSKLDSNLKFSTCGLHRMKEDIIHHMEVTPANINDSIFKSFHYESLLAILGLILA